MKEYFRCFRCGEIMNKQEVIVFKYGEDDTTYYCKKCFKKGLEDDD